MARRSYRSSDEVDAALVRRASEEDRSPSYIIVKALEAYLDLEPDELVREPFVDGP